MEIFQHNRRIESGDSQDGGFDWVSLGSGEGERSDEFVMHFVDERVERLNVQDAV